MVDPDLWNSFYGSHILGKPYHEELRPSSLTRISHPRMAFSGIDPVVQHRSSSSLSGQALRYDRSQNTRDIPHSVGHATYRPLHKPIVGSHGRDTIFSPPPLPSRMYTKHPVERIHKIPKTTPHELQKLSNNFERTESPIYHNNENGLAWHRFNNASPRMVEKKNPTNQKYSRYKVTKDRMQVQRFKRADEELNRTDTSQQSTEDDSSGQYRTVLYVVPSSPKSASPSYWGTPKIERMDLPKVNHSRSESHQIEMLKTKSKKNKLKVFDQESSAEDGSSSDQSPPFHITKPNIIFQGPGRYLETKPYCKTIPSPQPMEVSRKSNGLHNVNLNPRTVNITQKSPIKIIKNDYNQVVVDIKPRHLNEADKQQHVSQWIEVGTLGDTVQTKPEINESTMDDHDFPDPTDVEDGIDGVDVNGLTHSPVSLPTTTPANKPANGHTLRDTISPSTPKVEWFPRPSVDTFNKTNTDIQAGNQEEQNISEAGQSGSIRSNLILNVGSSPTRVSTEVLTFPVGKENIDSMNSGKTKSVNSHFNRTFSPTVPEGVHKINDSTRSPVSIDKGETLSIEKDSSLVNHIRAKPRVAPKPYPKQRISPTANKLSTELSEMKHEENKLESKASNKSETHDIHRKGNLNGGPNENDSSNDVPASSPGRTVKSLTAYFMNIINRQKGFFETNTFPRTRGRESAYSLPRDERGLPASSSPFFQNETPEEREKRLRAVDALRHRTLPMRTIDYSRMGSVTSTRSLYEGNFEEYYPYVRPSSVPRPRTKCLTTNITRSSTALSVDLNE